MYKNVRFHFQEGPPQEFPEVASLSVDMMGFYVVKVGDTVHCFSNNSVLAYSYEHEDTRDIDMTNVTKMIQ